MATAADIHKLTSRIARVAKQETLDTPSREVIRSGVKQLLATDSPVAGQFVASLLHLSHGRQAAEAAWKTVHLGVFVGDDVENVSVGHFCLAHGELRSLRPIVEMGPPPVAPSDVQSRSRFEWLVYLCRTSLSPRESQLLSSWESIATTAVATSSLPKANVDAALQLSWDCDPKHVEVSELASLPGAPGALPREFLMRQRIESSPSSIGNAEEPAATRRRMKAV